MLRINDVYQYQDLSIRILKTLSEHIVWIDINDVKALPEIISKTELFHAIESFDPSQIFRQTSPLSFLSNSAQRLQD